MNLEPKEVKQLHPRSTLRRSSLPALALAMAGLLCACGSDDDKGSGGSDAPLNAQPANLMLISNVVYDGGTDDLLTAGLGKTGLGSAVAPTTSATPTRAELRRLAIYNNYRALLDMTPAGGYGVFYGPNVDSNYVAGTGEGRVAGLEAIAYVDDGSGTQNVTLMVHLPDSFNPADPCIITATSSGSRGIYGGISTGEWGLKKGCAVAYTDKGTGAAPHDLAADTVPLIDGTRSTSAAAGTLAAFRAKLSTAELATLNTATPNRFAFKHAHSQLNPQKDWGGFTLRAVEFAFWVINQKYGALNAAGERTRSIVPANTIVIASSLSNGGGAAVAAAEQDSGGLIDGVAVSEPAVEIPDNSGAIVRRGGQVVGISARTLIDYTTHANLYQACASLSSQVAGAPGAAFVVAAFATSRCASLKAKGLLTGSTAASQADEALQKLRAYGWEAESDLLHASHIAFEVAPAVAVTFANALARSSVKDHLCGFSFGSTAANGLPNALPAVALSTMFSSGNGVPPAAGVQLINNLSVGAPLRDLFSFSPSTASQDLNLDGALCLRNLLTGSDDAARRLQTGLGEVRRNGRLGGRPAIIVHGRADALLPANHTSRPYTALSRRVDGTASKLSYIEVTNAQHFDGFIGLPAILPGYDTRFIPLHVYLNRALDAVYANLKNGTPLPPSQVLRTVPRGGTPGAAPALTAAHLPAFAATPSASNAITFEGSTLSIPD